MELRINRVRIKRSRPVTISYVLDLTVQVPPALPRTSDNGPPAPSHSPPLVTSNLFMLSSPNPPETSTLGPADNMFGS